MCVCGGGGGEMIGSSVGIYWQHPLDFCSKEYIVFVFFFFCGGGGGGGGEGKRERVFTVQLT